MREEVRTECRVIAVVFELHLRLKMLFSPLKHKSLLTVLWL